MNSSLDSVKDVLEYERYAAVHDVEMTLAYAKKLEAFLDSKGCFHSLLPVAYSSVDHLWYCRLHGSLDCMRQLWRYYEHLPWLCNLLQLWLHGLWQHWLYDACSHRQAGVDLPLARLHRPSWHTTRVSFLSCHQLVANHLLR